VGVTASSLLEISQKQALMQKFPQPAEKVFAVLSEQKGIPFCS
jgi:hypothetical protein